jgi:hypothetical protein
MRKYGIPMPIPLIDPQLPDTWCPVWVSLWYVNGLYTHVTCRVSVCTTPGAVLVYVSRCRCLVCGIPIDVYPYGLRVSLMLSGSLVVCRCYWLLSRYTGSGIHTGSIGLGRTPCNTHAHASSTATWPPSVYSTIHRGTQAPGSRTPCGYYWQVASRVSVLPCYVTVLW